MTILLGEKELNLTSNDWLTLSQMVHALKPLQVTVHTYSQPGMSHLPLCGLD